MITYLYFWFFEYFKTENTDKGWQKVQALIGTSGILIMNITSVLLFINSVLFKEVNLLTTILSENRIFNRVVILPALVSPVLLLVYFIGYKRIDIMIEFFRNESVEEKRRKRIWILIYFIISFIIGSLSIFSPAIFK